MPIAPEALVQGLHVATAPPDMPHATIRIAVLLARYPSCAVAGLAKMPSQFHSEFDRITLWILTSISAMSSCET
jgi:hypothetical protein